MFLPLEFLLQSSLNYFLLTLPSLRYTRYTQCGIIYVVLNYFLRSIFNSAFIYNLFFKICKCQIKLSIYSVWLRIVCFIFVVVVFNLFLSTYTYMVHIIVLRPTNIKFVIIFNLLNEILISFIIIFCCPYLRKFVSWLIDFFFFYFSYLTKNL